MKDKLLAAFIILEFAVVIYLLWDLFTALGIGQYP